MVEHGYNGLFEEEVSALARDPIGALIVGVALAVGFLLSRIEPVRKAFGKLTIPGVVVRFGSVLAGQP